MNAQRVALLTVEQHELLALAKQTAEVVPFMTKESCEACIRALLPHVSEALGASEVVIPEGLAEKKGMDLINAIRERREIRQGDAALLSSPVKDQKKQLKKKKVEPPLSSPKGTRSATKKRDRDVTIMPEVVIVEEEPKKMGPPRKQSKPMVAPPADHSDVVHEEDLKEEQEEEEEWDDWNAKTHGNISEVIRLGVRDEHGPFGMFILARKTGSGHRTNFPFFAYGDELKAVDKIKDHDKAKHKRTVQLLLKAVQKHVEKEGAISDALRTLLEGSQWGQEVLAQVSDKSSDRSDSVE